MGRLPGDALARRDTLTALLFRLEQQPDPADLAALVDEVMGWFRRHPAVQDLMRLFTELVRQAVAGIEPRVALPDDLLEARTMLATLGQDWKRQWVAEGRAEGKAEGKADTLIRFAERRFGPLSADTLARIRAADEAKLDAWIDCLVDATDLKAVFGVN